MALQRETPQTHRLIIAVGIVIAVLVILGLVLLEVRPVTAPGPKSVSVPSLDLLSQSLDLFQIEYSKVLKGTAPAQTGAPGAIDRAIGALDENSAVLTELDATAVTALQADLSALKAALSATPPTDQAAMMAHAAAQITRLRQAYEAKR